MLSARGDWILGGTLLLLGGGGLEPWAVVVQALGWCQPMAGGGPGTRPVPPTRPLFRAADLGGGGQASGWALDASSRVTLQRPP